MTTAPSAPLSPPRAGREEVVLVDDEGRPIGTADKATVHGTQTPRHLGFSCYGFDGEGRLLLTQRARSKRTFPLVWSNTCCGHPAPGEPIERAVERRLRHELGVQPRDLRLVLPEFSYRASDGDVEENELCPVFTCRIDTDPTARPDEVEAWRWETWEAFATAAADPASGISPWARWQAPLLAEALAL